MKANTTGSRSGYSASQDQALLHQKHFTKQPYQGMLSCIGQKRSCQIQLRFQDEPPSGSQE